MPSTTNFNWTTPADTDLVKDGAAAIRTLGNGIDTSFVDLKGGTTGQYLKKNSNTDLDYVWGDVSAGGMTLLSTTTLSSTSTVISNISGNYTNLLVMVHGAVWGTAGAVLQFRFNGSTTIAYGYLSVNNAASALETFYTDGQITSGPLTVKNTGGLNATSILVNNYANTSYYKNFSIENIVEGSSNFAAGTGGGALKTTSAITSLTITNSLGYTFSAGEVLIYGVK